MATTTQKFGKTGFGKTGFGKQTKLQSLCDQLTGLAHQLGPDAKLPKMTELRDTLGASIATINSALGELEAQNVICRKHGVGIYVSPKINQRTIALLCDPIFFKGTGHSPFWDLLIESARDRAASHNEDFSLHFTRPAQLAEVALQDGLMGEIESGRINGVLGVGLTKATADCLISKRVPLVAFAGPANWGVGIDSAHGIRLSVEALAAQGCKRIGLWQPISPARPVSMTTPHNTDNLPAFQNALKKCGLKFDASLVQDGTRWMQSGTLRDGGLVEIKETHQEQGYHAACEVFGAPKTQRPDGLVISDDMMTHGALVAFGKMGVKLGKHVKIATAANRDSQVLMGHEDELTRIEVDPGEIVDKMFVTLEAAMDGKNVPHGVFQVKPKIVS